MGSEFIWQSLSDFWTRLKERSTVEAFWDASLRQASNLYANLYQINFSKSLATIINVPEIRSEAKTLLFNNETISSINETTITGFPHTYTIRTEILRITQLHYNPDPEFTLDPAIVGTILLEDIDYTIFTDFRGDRIIAFVKKPPTYLHSNFVYRDEMLAFRNFGGAIEFNRPDLFVNTLEYIAALQGLYAAYFTGPTMENIEFGANLVLGFPFMGPGKVIDVQQDPITLEYTVLVDDVVGRREILVPRRIGPPSVSPGQVVENFRKISSSGITSIDYVRDLDFALSSGVEPPQIFFTTFLVLTFADTQQAVKNAGSTERFLDLYIANLTDFMEKIKPEYVDFVITFLSEGQDIFVDTATWDPDELDILVDDDISSKINENYFNILGNTTTPLQTFELDDEAIGLDEFLLVEVFATSMPALILDEFEQGTGP
jgi:hypothetical protein